MSSPKKSGNVLELELQEMHPDGVVEPYVYIEGYYTDTGLTLSYKPDLVTATRVIEAKRAATRGAKEKLIQALYKQKLLGKQLKKQAFLIYDGEEYENYVNNDPCFEQAIKDHPEVIVTSFANYKKNYS